MDEFNNEAINSALIRFYKELEKKIVRIEEIFHFFPKNKRDFNGLEYYYSLKGDGKFHPCQIILLGSEYFIMVYYINFTVKK